MPSLHEFEERTTSSANHPLCRILTKRFLQGDNRRGSKQPCSLMDLKTAKWAGRRPAARVISCGNGFSPAP